MSYTRKEKGNERKYIIDIGHSIGCFSKFPYSKKYREKQEKKKGTIPSKKSKNCEKKKSYHQAIFYMNTLFGFHKKESYEVYNRDIA